MKPLLTLSVMLFLFSCTPESNQISTEQMDAYVPIYASTTDVNDIRIEPPKPIVQAGKIYAFDNFIFQNDLNSGIHIVDITNRTNPQKISFLKLPLSTEVAVKGNYLYSNIYKDLVVFDISNPTTPRLVKRIANVFPPDNQKYPPLSTIYFECPNETKGVVVRWELKRIATPKCRR
jgi:hypothetical protein